MQGGKLLLISMALATMALANTKVAFAAEGRVTWTDPSCGFFVVKLPEGDPKQAYGLFSWKANPGPEVGDMVEGDLNDAEQPDIVNKRTGATHAVIHWANAGKQEQLVRNTPVQCASKWSKRKK